jgi:hypothetical protein
MPNTTPTLMSTAAAAFTKSIHQQEQQQRQMIVQKKKARVDSIFNRSVILGSYSLEIFKGY